MKPVKNWADIRSKRFSVAEREELDRRVRDELRDMNLAELRRELGITQEALAAALEVDQTQVSRLERRDDHLVSTLRRCVEALGGELEVTAVVGSKRVKLSV
jgi:predicted transcriptional regulator